MCPRSLGREIATGSGPEQDVLGLGWFGGWNCVCLRNCPGLPSMFFGVGLVDSSTYLAVSGAISPGALLGCDAPVRRASRVTMTDALRIT